LPGGVQGVGALAQAEGGGMPDMSKMQENMKKQDEEIKKILTKEQYKIYSDEQKRMMEQFGGGGF